MTYQVICTVNGVDEVFVYTDCTDAMNALHKFIHDHPDYYEDRNFRIVPIVE